MSIYFDDNLNRGAQLSWHLNYILASKWNLTHGNPSVFYADQRFMRVFENHAVAYQKRQQSICPFQEAEPLHPQDQGLTLQQILYKWFCYEELFANFSGSLLTFE